MCICDTYNSISAPSEGLFKDRGSRFLAFAYPVETEDEVREIIRNLRNRFHDARHCCYAYRLGKGGEKWRANDDGEPSGSASRPILGQIDSAGLSDVLVAVVRYFGGVKLGVPGLINAYREASSEALANAPKVQKVSGKWARIEFACENFPQVMKMAKEMDLPQRNQAFDEICTLELRVRDSLWQDFLEQSEKMSKLVDSNEK